ncbi:uncharacterized protein LOC107607017 [Arachis ipaensis]|uniref:uncharacterized protein LOC107607017 n=1 Tax=Arachis ipaensis TaxID=130454 RepID=UPI0007AFD487|nr:uncharacterized protein LOC107607017 [Arachis ipaensis]XP_025664605.1 uncharacterized protein LOC112763048 [Arachis hypogaea]
MPTYAKFIKDILSNKRDWREAEIVIITKECSAVIQRNLPEKLQDPGSFIISCTIRNTCIKKALCDLGASINLMPLSLMRKLQIEEIEHIRICLQLADPSVKFPLGVVEDLLVQVGPFTFPGDFMILDMEEEKNASIILGRPFLATGRTIIDVQKGEVTLRVNEDEVVLNAVEAMQYPNPSEECMRIDAIEPLVKEVFEAEKLEEELDTLLQDTLPELDEPAPQKEALNTPSVEEGPPKLELKPLPRSLKNSTLKSGTERGSENQVADHLSRIEPEEGTPPPTTAVNETFPDEYLLVIHKASWFADIANYKAMRFIPKEHTKQQVEKLLYDA